MFKVKTETFLQTLFKTMSSGFYIILIYFLLSENFYDLQSANQKALACDERQLVDITSHSSQTIKTMISQVVAKFARRAEDFP